MAFNKPKNMLGSYKELGLPMGPRKKIVAAIAELTIPAVALGSTPKRKAERQAERRQLTVMFCDIVGSTELSERLDPEDLRDVLRAYQETCAQAVERFEGHLAKYIGDGLLIYFGYPQAHEDDAQRAVRSALAIVEGLEKLNERLTQNLVVKLEIRVGIHTGLVVAGEMGGGETREADAIVGDTPNVAARLERLAEPNTIAISAATHALVEGLFECDELGPQNLKGVSDAVGVYRVCGESGVHSRFEASVERGLTKLVGREEEISLLLKRWAQATDGEGQVVLLSGEAGVGKSRILRGFRHHLEDEPHSRILYYGSPYHQNSAFYPVSEQFQRALRFSDEDDIKDKLNKLENVINNLGLDVGQNIKPLASLLSLQTGTSDQAPEISPQKFKTKTLEATIAIYEGMAAQMPVLMVVEDAHWIDPSTIELLNLAIDRLPAARLLLLITFRPDFQAPWAGLANLTQLALNRLGRRDATAIVTNVTAGKEIPDEVLDQIIARSDGVPLYLEELTRTVLDSGLLIETDRGYMLNGPLTAFAIPSSLQDSLMARLDRLASVKEVAQLAATIGRVFSQELLAATSPLGKIEIDNALDKLVKSGLVYRRGLPPLAGYEFKHALIRDAAYESLLKRTRQQHHHRIAEVLKEQFPAIARSEPEVLAHHYTEASLYEPAIREWLRAGQRAIERSAIAETVAHCDRGLDLNALLPESKERDLLEIQLLFAKGPSYAALNGYTSPVTKQIYSRASEIAAIVGTSDDQFIASWGLWLYETQCGHHDEGQALVKQMLADTKDKSDPGFRLQAHHCAWTTLYALDNLPAVLAHTASGIELYNIDQHRDHAFQYGGHDPGVCSYMHAALAQWQLGFADQAPETMRKALTLSQRLAHPTSQVLATYYATMLNQFLRKASEAEVCAMTVIEMCERHSFPHYLSVAHVLHGWSLAMQDRSAEGIAEIEEGLQAYRASGAVLRVSYYLSLLAYEIHTFPAMYHPCWIALSRCSPLSMTIGPGLP